MRAQTTIRTCIGCRQRGPAADMARLTIVADRVTAAARRPDGGRGASLHPRRDCVARALKRAGAFANAFKRPVTAPDGDELLRQLARFTPSPRQT